MGLAGPKKNNKISADPRNTHWASNTDRFGHKILESYGWTPGTALGDTSSAHHAHLTTASHTGIKVMLKDDFLGIGAKKGTQDDECTGLDVFQNLLGRLNGKSAAAIEKDIATRSEIKKNIIIGERYRMRFVEGGVYVSSDIEQLIAAQAALNVEDRLTTTPPASMDKAFSETENVEIQLGLEATAATRTNLHKTSKKRKKSESEDLHSGNDREKSKLERKRAKREKKEEKRKLRRSKTPQTAETTSKTESSKSKDKSQKEERRSKSNAKKGGSSGSDGASTPETTEISTRQATSVLTGRHAIRQRYIMAKRSAVMDSKALNEIFMVKA